MNALRFCLHFELEYKIYVRSGFRRYHQNKYQIHKCDVAIIIGEKISTTKKRIRQPTFALTSTS